MPAEGLRPIRMLSDEGLVERVLSDLQRLAGDKADALTRNRRYQAMYEGLDNPDDVIDENDGTLSEDRGLYSNTNLPIGAMIADTAIAQLYNHLFPTPDYFRIEADDWLDDLAAIRVTAHQKRRHKEIGLRRVAYSALQQAVCFDYGVTFESWKMRPGYVKKMVREETIRQYGKIKMPYRDVSMQEEWIPNAIDRPEVEIIDYFNCVHDCDSMKGIEDSTVFIDWRYEPLEDLELMSQSDERFWGRYKNIKQVIDNFHQNLHGSNAPIQDDYRDRGSKPHYGRVLVVRYWTQDQVVEVCNGQVISRTNIDGMPLQIWKCYKVPGQFRGMGILQRLERMQYDVNAIINIKRDFQNLSLTGIGVVDEDLVGHIEGDIELYPGRTFVNKSGKPAKDLLHFHQPGYDLSQGASEELSAEIDTMNKVAGFDDNAMGSFSPGRKTARETSAVAAGMLTKVKQMAERLEEEALEPMYYRIFLLDQTYMSKEEAFKYQGAEGTEYFIIRPEDYRWGSKPRFECLGSSYLAYHDLHVQQFFTAAKMAYEMYPQGHNWQNIFAKIWQMMDPKDHLHMIRDPRDRTEDIPPAAENFMMAHGQNVQVSPENDHQKHIQAHKRQEMSMDYQIWPLSFKNKLKAHIMEHEQTMMGGRQQAGKLPEIGQQDASDPMRGVRGIEVA